MNGKTRHIREVGKRSGNGATVPRRGLVSFAAIRRLARTIADKFHPEKIILFGSYAYGRPTQDSDVDLLVVKRAKNEMWAGDRMQGALEVPFQLQLMVRDPIRIEQRIHAGDWFLREITTKGRVLYESNVQTEINGSDWEDPMLNLTAEWVEKAEKDYGVSRLVMNTLDPDWDNICFHAQQMMEKYLKAQLQEAGVPFPKIHDLEKLMGLVTKNVRGMTKYRSGLATLTKFAVETRYPGLTASARRGRWAVAKAEALRREVRERLGLDV